MTGVLRTRLWTIGVKLGLLIPVGTEIQDLFILSNIRGTRVRGYEGTRVLEPEYVLEPENEVLEPGYEGIRTGVRGYLSRGTY